MDRVVPQYMANLRRLLLALVAIGLVLRLAAGCEAMAAVPQAITASATHCEKMPATPGKPIKVELANCALCYALPDAAITRDRAANTIALEPVASLTGGLAGLNGGPAPPPPKIA